ncbi:DUF3597 domain-containing protein [Leisingera caerulea]|uniref:DUF3597 domain-containing protein n=1 Tax=Leisingera caerulea TaxID=506591 RepID=UPI0021A65EC7|nr:DUF3597 domain-containing protein [Leisingera caerulea]UWQ84652.1 DUF3597 domain-containing protein [Leisingera caerulea]
MIEQNVFSFVSLRGVQKKGQSPKIISSPIRTTLTEQFSNTESLTDADVVQLCEEYAASGQYSTENSMPEDLVLELLNEKTVGEAIVKFEAVVGTEVSEFVSDEHFVFEVDKGWDSYYCTLKVNDLRSDMQLASINAKSLSYIKWLDDESETPNFPNFNVEDFESSRLVCPLEFYPATVGVDADAQSSFREFSEGLDQTLNRIQKLTDLADELEFLNRNKFPTVEVEFEEHTKDDADVRVEEVVSALQSIESGPLWVYDEDQLSNLKEASKEILKSLPAYHDGRGVVDLVESARDQAKFLGDRIIETSPRNLVLQLISKDRRLRSVMSLTGFDLALGTHEVPSVSDDGIALPDVPLPHVSIGDLYVVRQRLRGYQLGEVAHIQNVLETESYRREHSRIRETEETLLTEFQQTTETEKHLETTDRFELTREAKKSIEARQRSSAGFSVTASYGPISATARADTSSEKAVSESVQAGEVYAKEVVSEAMERVSTTVQETRTQRILERSEERNEHAFDNSSGSGNVTGIYRWVEKRYENILVNYGRRLMIEFIIPEPAAFYVSSLASAPMSLGVKKPPKPVFNGKTLLPSHLTKYNYQAVAAPYQVKDLPAYPESSKAVSGTIAKMANGSGNAAFAEKFTIQLDEGYRVQSFAGVANWVSKKGGLLNIAMAGTPWSDLSGIFGRSGSLDLSATGWLMSVTANVLITQEATQKSTQKWQSEVYEKIMTAYEQQLKAYNDAVASFEAEEQQSITSRPEATVADIEFSEVKKGAVRAISGAFSEIKVGGQWLTDIKFDSMKSDGDQGFPEFDVEEVNDDAKIIGFFEQAFEWENMAFFHYPYLWARKEKWIEMALRQDDNKGFEAFLKAGATRVVVPARPAHSKHVLHFLKTKEIWSGDNPPVLGDEDYVSVSDEIEAKTDFSAPFKLPICSDGLEPPCIVRSWQTVMPTSLISLQEDTELPSFDGDQQEVDIEEILDAKAASMTGKFNWRTSIVDLLKVIDLPSTLADRRRMAEQLGYDADAAQHGPSKQLNIWLHARVMDVLIENGGEWPS